MHNQWQLPQDIDNQTGIEFFDIDIDNLTVTKFFFRKNNLPSEYEKNQ
jgi:hypothetical protein